MAKDENTKRQSQVAGFVESERQYRDRDSAGAAHEDKKPAEKKAFSEDDGDDFGRWGS